MLDVTLTDEGDYDVVVTNSTAGFSVTSRAAELIFLGLPELLTVSEGASLFVGDSIDLEVVARGAATLSYQWNFNGSPITGENSTTLSLANVELTDDGDYTVTVTNGIGSITSDAIAIAISVNAARIDPDFRSSNSNNASANHQVFAIESLSDGSAIVGGLFSSIAGGSATRIAKFDSDGELIAGWGASFNSTVRVIKELSNGQFLVGGNFTSVNNDSGYRYLVRLNSDGTLDTAYDPDVNSVVYDIALFSDDAAAIVGTFTNVNGSARSYIAKLSTAGVLDTAFKVTATNWISEVEIDSLGRVYVGAVQNSYPVDDGVSNFNSSYLRFFRSTAGGVLDTAYTPSSNGFINDMQIQSDDTFYIAGSFNSIGGGSRTYFARLDSAGVLDTALPDLSLNNQVHAFDVDASGNVILSGSFTSILGNAQTRLAMIDSSGVSVATFFVGSGLNSQANDIEVDALGKIWIGGGFTVFNNISSTYLTRLVGFTLGPEVETFASFISDAGLTGPDAGFDFDYDNDGIVNGLEFLFGGDAVNTDAGLMPTPMIQNGTLLSTGDTEDYVTMSVSIDEDLIGAFKPARHYRSQVLK